MIRMPKNFQEEHGSCNTGATKLRYRLYADGTIIDQETGKVAGYITDKFYLDYLWKLNGRSKQMELKKHIFA